MKNCQILIHPLQFEVLIQDMCSFCFNFKQLFELFIVLLFICNILHLNTRLHFIPTFTCSCNAVQLTFLLILHVVKGQHVKFFQESLEGKIFI